MAVCGPGCGSRRASENPERAGRGFLLCFLSLFLFRNSEYVGAAFVVKFAEQGLNAAQLMGGGTFFRKKEKTVVAQTSQKFGQTSVGVATGLFQKIAGEFYKKQGLIFCDDFPAALNDCLVVAVGVGLKEIKRVQFHVFGKVIKCNSYGLFGREGGEGFGSVRYRARGGGVDVKFNLVAAPVREEVASRLDVWKLVFCDV